MLAFVVLINPIAGNGVVPEKFDFYRKRIRDFPGGSDGKASAYNVGDLGQEDPPEKEMATHSSTLAWKIPWTEEHDRLLQSMGSKKIANILIGIELNL